MDESEQLLLFEDPPSAWVKKIWKTIEAPRRQEIVSILAKMGKDSLEKETSDPRKENARESQ
jgi:hypothetical protein